jgi:pilus assembly protein Flp/PilA
MKSLFNRFIREESGQDIIEYALLAAFVSIVAWGILVTIGTDVKSIYTNVNAATTDASTKSGAAGS